MNIPAKIYSPEMCSVVTSLENNQNRTISNTISYKGEIKSYAEWGEVMGLPWKTIWARINDLKWSEEKALTTPIKNKTKFLSSILN